MLPITGDIVAGMAAAFLTLSFSQSKLIANGSEGEIALHVAEAGVEDTINKLTAYSKAWIKNGYTDPVYALGTAPDFAIIATTANSITVTGTVNGGTFQAILTTTLAGAPRVYTGPFAPTAPPHGYLLPSN